MYFFRRYAFQTPGFFVVLAPLEHLIFSVHIHRLAFFDVVVSVHNSVFFSLVNQDLLHFV